MVKEDDLLMLHVGGALATWTRYHLTFSSVPTTYIPSGTTPPLNTTAAPQPPFSDCPHCLNGGTYVGGYCQCLVGYSGVYCEMAIYSPPGTYGKGTGLCMGDVVNSAAVYVHTYSPSHPLLLYSFSSLPSLSSLTLSPLSPPSTPYPSLSPLTPPSLLYTLA